MTLFVKELYRDQEGQGLAEYGLILSLIVLGAIMAMGLFGDSLKILYQRVKDDVVGAT